MNIIIQHQKIQEVIGNIDHEHFKLESEEDINYFNDDLRVSKNNLIENADINKDYNVNRNLNEKLITKQIKLPQYYHNSRKNKSPIKKENSLRLFNPKPVNSFA